jgi:co-chaperonin GroES (HSP10)
MLNDEIDGDKFVPVGNRVLLKRDEGIDKSESGVWFSREQKSNIATVIAIGDDEEKISSHIKVGSRIFFVDHPQSLDIDKYMLLPSEAILGVIA